MNAALLAGLVSRVMEMPREVFFVRFPRSRPPSGQRIPEFMAPILVCMRPLQTKNEFVN